MRTIDVCDPSVVAAAGEEPPLAALASEAEEAAADAATAATEDSLQGDSHAAAAAVVRPDAPAVLLVHGFGAFGEQWRGQILALTRAGYKVHLTSLSAHVLMSETRILALARAGYNVHLSSYVHMWSCLECKYNPASSSNIVDALTCAGYMVHLTSNCAWVHI